jgi:SOS response regulatory protein OraA/RecX
VLARGRYSNGLLAEGRISEKSSIYNEILVNMRSLSQDVPKVTARNLTSSLDERKLSLEEKNALKEARSYLSCEYLEYSRTGLIEQLEYEGYSTESATMAVDSLSVDWNAQAVATAKSYMSSEHLSFSRKGLIEQLEYKGFSTESATMAVDSLSVDWNAQAAATAKSYMSSEHLSFSRKGLIEQLEYKGFSTEQAEFGAKSVGY